MRERGTKLPTGVAMIITNEQQKAGVERRSAIYKICIYRTEWPLDVYTC